VEGREKDGNREEGRGHTKKKEKKRLIWALEGG
jgi:hypothetical protein